MDRKSAVLAATIAFGTIATAAVAGAGVTAPVTHTTTVEFGFTGASARYRVPVGVDTIAIAACGAEGGTGVDAGTIGLPVEFGAAGLGAGVTAEITPPPQGVITVRVGGRGGDEGGFNGGGTSLLDPLQNVVGQGGGGATDLRIGGSGLADRVVVAGGGGGGGGGIVGIGPGGATLLGGGGGLVGGDATDVAGGGGGTQSAGGLAGVGAFSVGTDGALGAGGSAPSGSGGGGGGLFGGGGGSVPIGYGGGGGGGSSLGDEVTTGACSGDGSLSMSFVQPLSVRPYAAVVTEGDTGTQTIQVPVILSAAVDEVVTAAWQTIDGAGGPGLATEGVDFVGAAGTVTFVPGETVAYIPIEILADSADEPDLLWGEWGVVQLSGVSANAVLETGPFFGAALFIIVDDD